MSINPAIDRATMDELIATVGDDFIFELIDTYLEETPQLVARMRAALAAGDADSFRRAAHSMKSSSASLGAIQLSGLAREMEMMGKQGDLAGGPAGLAVLEDEYARVERAFKELKHES